MVFQLYTIYYLYLYLYNCIMFYLDHLKMIQEFPQPIPSRDIMAGLQNMACLWLLKISELQRTDRYQYLHVRP